MAVTQGFSYFAPALLPLGGAGGSFMLIEAESLESTTASGSDESQGYVLLPSAEFLLDGEYVRSGEDLLIHNPAGETFVVEGYFATHPPPLLKIDSGALLTPQVVESLLSGPTAQLVMVAGPDTLPQAELIGKAAQLLGKVTAKGADGQSRDLKEGEVVYKGDVLQTAKGGLVKVVFNDKTEFQLGEDARVILNNYVYNPAKAEGKFEATVVKGMFRYASGDLAHLNAGRHSVVKTPSTVIGIRGSELLGEVGEDGLTTVVHLSGVLDISDALGQGMITLLESGTATEVRLDGGPPKPIFKAPENFLAKVNAQMDIAKAKEKADEEQKKGGQEGKGGGDRSETRGEEKIGAQGEEHTGKEKTGETSESVEVEERGSGDSRTDSSNFYFSSIVLDHTTAQPAERSPSPSTPTSVTNLSVTNTTEYVASPTVGAYTNTPGTVESPVIPTSNGTPTGSVTITGVAQQQGVLTASHTLADADGMGPVSYKWQTSVDGQNWGYIPGANANTLALTAAEVGKLIRVEVAYIDGHSLAEQVVSTSTPPVKPHEMEVVVIREDTAHLLTGSILGLEGVTNANSVTVKFTALPSEGRGHLTLGDIPLKVGDVVGLIDINTGNLVFVPGQDRNGEHDASLSFVVGDAGTFSSHPNEVVFDITAVNDAPTVQGNTLTLFNGLMNLLTGALDQGMTAFPAELADLGGFLFEGNLSELGKLVDMGTLGGLPELLQKLKITGQLHAQDVENDSLYFQIVKPAAHGTVVITDAATGAFTYTPDGSFALVDQFTFTVNDGRLGSKEEIIVIKMFPDEANIPGVVNHLPTGSVGVIGTVMQSATLVVDHDLADRDGLGLIAYQWQASANGLNNWVDIAGANSQSFTLTKKEVDQHIRVVASYTDGMSAQESVASTSTGKVARLDTGHGNTTKEDVPHTITEEILGISHSEIGHDSIQVKVVALPQVGHGHLELNGVTQDVGAVVGMSDLHLGHFVYVPETNGNGVAYASISLQVGKAGVFDNPPVLHTMDVLPVNDIPQAKDGSLPLLDGTLPLTPEALQNLTVTGHLNATDVDGDPLSFIIADQPSHGAVVLTDAATGAFSYTQNSGFSLEDHFTFRATDGTSYSNTATMTIKIDSSIPIDLGNLDLSGLGKVDLSDLNGLDPASLDGMNVKKGTSSGTVPTNSTHISTETVVAARVLTTSASAHSQAESDHAVAPPDNDFSHSTPHAEPDLTFDFRVAIPRPVHIMHTDESVAAKLTFDFFATDASTISTTTTAGGKDASEPMSPAPSHAFLPTDSGQAPTFDFSVTGSDTMPTSSGDQNTSMFSSPSLPPTTIATNSNLWGSPEMHPSLPDEGVHGWHS